MDNSIKRYFSSGDVLYIGEREIELEYSYGDIVYVITDVNQLPCIVVGFNIVHANLYYLVNAHNEDYKYSNIEITRERNLVLTTTN